MQRDGTDPPSQPGSEPVATKKTRFDYFKNRKSVEKFQKGQFHEKKLFSTNGDKRLLYPKLFAGKKFTRNCVKKCGWPWKEKE